MTKNNQRVGNLAAWRGAQRKGVGRRATKLAATKPASGINKRTMAAAKYRVNGAWRNGITFAAS